MLLQYFLPKLKALIIEDERSLMMLAKHSLMEHRDASFDVATAGDLRAGWQSFKHIKPHLVLLDINLPDGNGLDLIQNMLAEYPDAYIVMLTGSAYETDVEKAKELGAYGYIVKPFSRGKFNEMVQACMEFHESRGGLSHVQQPNNKEVNLKVVSSETKAEAEAEMPLSRIDNMVRSWDVLFVDDFYANVDNAERHLRRTGCKFDIAYTAAEAQKKIENNHYQLIFMDTQLDHSASGYKIIQNLRQKEQETERDYHQRSCVVALMENIEERDNRQWLLSGMNDYLVKPCSSIDLEKKLRKFAKQKLESTPPEAPSALA